MHSSGLRSEMSSANLRDDDTLINVAVPNSIEIPNSDEEEYLIEAKEFLDSHSKGTPGVADLTSNDGQHQCGDPIKAKVYRLLDRSCRNIGRICNRAL